MLNLNLVKTYNKTPDGNNFVLDLKIYRCLIIYLLNEILNLFNLHRPYNGWTGSINSFNWTKNEETYSATWWCYPKWGCDFMLSPVTGRCTRYVKLVSDDAEQRYPSGTLLSTTNDQPIRHNWNILESWLKHLGKYKNFKFYWFFAHKKILRKTFVYI
jgi:hypothetical protein